MKAFKKINGLFFLFISISSLIIAQSNWQEVNGPMGGNIRDLKRTDTGNYYAATSRGLYLSKDNCNNWERITSFSSTEIFVHPSGRLLVTSYDVTYTSNKDVTSWTSGTGVRNIGIDSNQRLYGVEQNIIYYSLDTAKSWIQLKAFNDYIFSFNMVDDKNFVVLCDTTIYYSSDAGYTWSKSNVKFVWNNRLIIDSKKNIYAMNDFDLYRSTDKGHTWYMFKSHLDENRIPIEYFGGFGIDKNDYIYLFTGYNFYVSKNDGLNWEVHSLNNFFISSLYDDTNGNIFFLSDFDGLYQYDYLNNILIPKSNGISAHNFYNIEYFNNSLLCMSYEHFFITNDGGNLWEGKKFPGELICIDNQDRIFANFYSEIKYSLDKGVTWHEISLPKSNNYYSQLLVYWNKLIYFHQNHEMFYSPNLGATWQQISLPYGGNKYGNVTQDANGNLYLSMSTELFFSSNYGETWKLLKEFDAQIYAISKSPWGNIYVSTGNGFYVSSVDNWEMIELYDFIGRILYSKYNYMIVIGSEIHLSKNFGRTFEVIPFVNGSSNIRDVAIDDSNNLYATPSSGGIFKYYLGTNTAYIPQDDFLFNNYPNPFNNQTTFEFYLNQPGEITLSIYNILGERIEQIVKSFSDRGIYRIEWSNNNISSGVYFCYLTTPNNSKTIKIMMLK